MELSTIRQQIEIKQFELRNLVEKYIEELDFQIKQFTPVIDKESKVEIKSFNEALNEISETYRELEIDFTAQTTLFKEIYMSLYSKAEEHLKNIREKMTVNHEGISITRQQLKYSTVVLSAGYDKTNRIMDLEYKSGGIYRYYEVPEEFVETMLTRSSIRNLKKEIEVFRYVKIQ